MQTVRACCRVLAACAAAFFSFSLEAAFEHPVYPTPQNLSAKIEIYNSARSLLLSWDDVTISGDAPSEAVYFIACRSRTAGSTEAWSDWDETTHSVQIPRVGQWGGRAEKRFLSHGRGKDWEYRVRCYNDFDYPDIYLSEWSETVRVTDTVDSFAFVGSVTSDHNLRRTYLNIPFSYTTSRTGVSSTPLSFSFTAIAIPDDGRIFEAGTVRRDGTPLAVAKLDVIKSGEISGTRVGDPTNFALSSGDGRFSWSVDMDLGLDYYHTNVTIVVQGYEPAETEGGTPRKVVDKAIGGVTIDTRTPWFTPTANRRGIILEWQKVTDAAKYVIQRTKVLGDETTETTYTTLGETAETTYTDSNFPDRYYTTQRYYYRINPIAADGTELMSSAWIPAYCRLDFLNADSVHFSPRFPWSGQLDFRIQNFSARDKRYDGLPRFKLTATHEGNPIPVRTATLGDGTVINPSDFTLVEDSPTNTMEWTRLVWDARADLGETNITSALDFKIEYIGLTTADGKPYVGDKKIEKSGPTEGLDTRLVPEIPLDGRTAYVYYDTGWWNPAAGYVLVDIEGTQRLSTSGMSSHALTADILPIWGTNTLTITTDRGESWTGYVKYPDFAFTVSEGNADGVTLAWNDIPGVTDYAVRRRPLGSDAAFETVETVTGATTWTDTTADEVGAYEYTVMPLLPGGSDAGPTPAAQRGYRTLEKVELVAARSDEPWTPRVAIDIAYTSGRVAATDGAVTYRLERTDGGPLTVLTNDVGVAIDPANVALASGVTNRIWWSAEADLGAAAVVSDIALRLVPTLAADAPEGAVAAPAALTCEPFAVDFRPTRDVTVGQTVSIPWLWTRTDARNEADDAIRIDANTWVGAKTLLDSPVGADARVGTLSFPVTLEYWTEFTLVKHEKNGGTDVATTSFVTYHLPAAAPQGLTATQGETNAVTLAWSAVPQASGYHIVADYTDCSREPAVTSTRDWHTSGDAATNTVDEAAPALGYAHYTVTAFYGNGATGPESTALGWRALDALELENVQTRKPWPSGRVDIDLVYTTARVTLRNRMGVSAPVPSITIGVQTAEGEVINVDSLVREPPVSAYTEHLDRRILTNGQLFSADDDSGSWRIVWDTASWDSPVPKLVATNAVLTVSIGDVVADTATFDLDTRRISRIPITADMETLPLRWATRWLEESPGMSLDLRRARNVRIVEIKDGVSNNLADEDLRDEEGIFSWTPPTDVANEVTVRATYDGMEKNAFTLTFFQAPAVNATAQYQADANAFRVTWEAVEDDDFAEVRYALLRRVVNRDGTTGAWTTVADALAATTYDDDSVEPDDLTVYEYSVRVLYSDGAGGWLDAAPSAGASAWANEASLTLAEPVLGAPWTATVGIDVEYATGQPVGGAADSVEVFARDADTGADLTVASLTLDGVAVVNGSFTFDKGTVTSIGRLVWNAGEDVPGTNLAHVVLGVRTVGSHLEKETAPFALDVRTRIDVAVGETIDIPWAWTRTDARDEADDTLVITANLNGDWDWTNLCEIAVGTGPREGVVTVTVTDDFWTSFKLEKHEMNGNTDETTTSFVTYRLPAEMPQGVSASRDVTNAVTVTWSAVPQAAGYKIVAEDCDAGGNRTTRPLSVSDGATTNYVDTASPVPGYTRYTVSAVYPNDAVGSASAAAIGWRSLDALTATVKTRTPWPSGKVDIDLSYETARHVLRAAGEDVPTSLPLWLAVRKADGTTLAVATLTREPMVDESTYTLNRDAFTNGQVLFGDSGTTRIVWNAGADATDTEAAGAVLSVSLGDRVVAEVPFDLDARRQSRLPLTNRAAIPLRWAARWVNEDSTSLNMMDGHDVRLVEEMDGTTRDLFNARSRDAEGVVDWTPPTDVSDTVTVKALYDGAEKADYTLTFFRPPEVNVTASRSARGETILVSWDAAPDAVCYAVLRRAVNRSGAAVGAWTTLADEVTTTSYEDAIGADDTTVYEYAIRIRYSDGAGGLVDAEPSAAERGWANEARLALSEPSFGAPWTPTVRVDVEYATGQPDSSPSDRVKVKVFAKDADTDADLTVASLTLDGVAVVNGSFTLDRGTATSMGRLVWNAGADAPEANLANVVLGVKTVGAGDLEKRTAPFALDVRTVRDVAVGETISIPWEWTRTDARNEADDKLVLTANLNGSWDWIDLCEIAVGAGPREGVATVTVTDDLWTSFTLEKHEMNGATDETATSFVTYRLPAVAPRNVSASRDVTDAVTVTWTAVPQAAGYKIVAEDSDVNGNRTTRPLSVSGGATTRYVDTAAPALGYTRYTVSALYPNDAVGAASAAAIGWRSLDALTAAVKTRTPWPSGKVDIDLSYETARHVLRAAGEDVPMSLPLTLAVRTADGAALTVAALTCEPTVDEGTYTLNRAGFTNGQTLFGDAGSARVVWDAGADATNTVAAGAVLSVSLGGRVVSETAFDLDTRRPDKIPLAADAAAIPLRWAARWADEGASSLNLMDGHDVRLVEETAAGATRDLFDARSRDAEGVVDWTPSADAQGLITVKALYDGAERADYTLTFFRTPEVNVTATEDAGDGTIRVGWDAVPGASHYQVLRRVVNRDGTKGDWTTVDAQVAANAYVDAVGADDTTVYEYAVRVCYANAADPDAPYVSTPSAAAAGWAKTASLALDGLTVSDPWAAAEVAVRVDFEYVTGQPVGTSDLAEVVVTDQDGRTNLTVQTLELDGVAVANGSFSLDKGVRTSTGRLVWNAGVDVPRVYLTNVVLRVKTAATGLEETVGPFTLDTCGTRAVFDALGPWLDGGATVVEQEVGATYGALPTATRAGYRLVGWFNGVTASARQVVAGMAPLTRDDHRLYAKWETEWNGEEAFAYEVIDETTVRITGLTGAVPPGGLVLPDTIDGYLVTEIGEGAFANRTDAFGTVSLPLFCTSVGNYAFYGATGLTGLSFVSSRDGVNPQWSDTLTIGESAFAGTGLSSVTIPAFVTSIDRWAFANCASLRTVTLLGTPVMGEDVFRRTPYAHGEGGASGGEGGDMPSGGEGGDSPSGGEGSSTNETVTVVDRILHGTSGEEAVSGAQTYRGYLYADSDVVAGTIDVKVARPQTRKGVTTVRVTATVRPAGERALTLRGTFEAADAIEVSLTAKDGRLLSLTIDAAGLFGTFGVYEIDGSRDVFASRTAEDKALAAAVLAPWKSRPLALVWSGDSGWNALAVTVGTKGRVKVAGTLASGLRVNVSTQLLVGPDWCFAPVVVSKKNVSLSFGLWFAKDGSETAVDGLSADATLGEATALDAGSAFRLDVAALCGLLGDDAYQDCLPDGLSVEPRGTKWVVADGARAGKVVLDASGAVDAAKAGANPSALKFTYRKKDGTFTGTFKAYRNVKGRPKAVTVKVTGIVLEGIGYGTATVGTMGKLPVTVE